jgi:hypothetical protein
MITDQCFESGSNPDFQPGKPIYILFNAAFLPCDFPVLEVAGIPKTIAAFAKIVRVAHRQATSHPLTFSAFLKKGKRRKGVRKTRQNGG